MSSTAPTLIRLDGVGLFRWEHDQHQHPIGSITAPAYIKVNVQMNLATSGVSRIMLIPNVNGTCESFSLEVVS